MRSATAVLGFLLCGVLSAQDTGKTLVNQLVKHWETSKELSVAVAEAMPEDGYSFKASPPEKTFGEQINHIAAANSFYCAAALGSKNAPPGDDNSRSSAIQNLFKSYDYCIGGLKGMTDADLEKTVPVRKNEATRFELFWGAFTHAAHHRGQVEVYLRLKNITPPDYKF